MNVPSVFSPVDVSWNRWAENSLVLDAVAGFTSIKLGPNFPGVNSSTGLANDATAYTATVDIDGTNRAVSIVGSAAQTVTTLVAELLTDLTTWATVELVGDAIVITSKATGATSAVFVSDTGTNHLFASLTGVSPVHFGVTSYDFTQGWFAIVGSVNRVGTSVRGNTKYLRWDKMGDVQQEYVSDVIDTFLAAVATTNTPWQNAAASIALPTTVPTLFTNTGLSRSIVYQLGVNANGAGAVQVYIDLNILETAGVPFDQLMMAVNVGLKNAGVPVVATWQNGYNATQPPRMLFQVVASNTPFTPTASGAVLQGTTSSLVLTAGGANDIIAALNGTFGAVLDTAQEAFAVVDFNRVNAAAVLPASVPAVTAGSYDWTVNIDGTSYDVTTAVTAADTMTVIAATMETDLQAATTGSETVEAVGNKFIISSTTADFTSVAVVTIPTAGANPDLFNAIAAAFDVVDPRGDTTVSTWSIGGFATPGVDGAVAGLSFPEIYNGVSYANWNDVLTAEPVGGRIGSGQYIHGPTGFGPVFTGGSGKVFEKEARPQALGQCVYGGAYWDGAAWRDFTPGDPSRDATDDTSLGTNNPNETLDSGV